MNCARCETPLEVADLRCCICALVVAGGGAGAAAATRVRARILRCRECAAAISYDAVHQAPRCAFCGSLMVIE